MRPRLLLIAILLVGCLGLVPTAASADDGPNGHGNPYVTLTPNFGPAGTVVTVSVYNFVPNIGVRVIFRSAGDPVVGTGKTGPDGRGEIKITVPGGISNGAYWVFVTDENGDCDSSARFTVRDVPPPPPPTPRPATPPPTQPPTTNVTPPPTTPPPPQPPSAGSGAAGGFAGSGLNLALIGLALAVFSSGFALWGSSHRRRVHAPASNRASRVARYGRHDNDS